VSAISTVSREALLDYVLRIADTNLILGQQNARWCGHAPVLEEDMAVSNIALDQIGQARLLLTLAGEIEGKGRDEDALAFHRDGPAFRNLLIVEQPNGDFAQTIARNLLVDAFHLELYGALARSTDPRLAGIAAKAVKECAYHVRHSSGWAVRLGDGTEESHGRMQSAVDGLWMWTGEMFVGDAIDAAMVEAGIGPDPASLKSAWDSRIGAVLSEATLNRPKEGWMQKGGKQGEHSEQLGYILTELQFLPRAYPGATW
jgi:ring-1,2-phenylacetyl-CoA epoxidase subunit PaaC